VRFYQIYGSGKILYNDKHYFQFGNYSLLNAHQNVPDTSIEAAGETSHIDTNGMP